MGAASAAEVPQGLKPTRKTRAVCRPEGLLHPASPHYGYTSRARILSPQEITIMTWHLTGFFLAFGVLLGLGFAQSNGGGVDTKASRNLLLVVNQGDQSMSLVDPEAGIAIGKVKTNEVRAHEVTASPDGRLAYLPIYGDSGVGKPGTNGGNVEIVDLDKQSIVGSIDLGPVRPHWVKFGPDGMLYVSAE